MNKVSTKVVRLQYFWFKCSARGKTNYFSHSFTYTIRVWNRLNYDGILYNYRLTSGGGMGKIFNIGTQPINSQVSAYKNVETPELGADWQFRLQLQFLFPKQSTLVIL